VSAPLWESRCHGHFVRRSSIVLRLLTVEVMLVLVLVPPNLYQLIRLPPSHRPIVLHKFRSKPRSSLPTTSSLLRRSHLPLTPNLTSSILPLLPHSDICLLCCPPHSHEQASSGVTTSNHGGKWWCPCIQQKLVDLVLEGKSARDQPRITGSNSRFSPLPRSMATYLP